MDSWKLIFAVLAALALNSNAALARKTEMPPSALLKGTLAVVQKVNAPKIDIAKFRAKAEAAELMGAAPKFAAPLTVNLTPKTAGTWQEFDAQNDLWRVQVSSANAKSLNLGFTKFALPEGAKLFVYAPGYKHVRGPFTAADNNKQKQLWTPIVFGDTSIVEVLVRKQDRSKLELALTSINHDYRGFGRKDMDKSGSCNVDVACQNERSGWESQIQSVAVISTGGSTFCTGFLVNNTAHDQRPLFMTANHCGINAGNAASLVAYWNYENSDCRQPGSPDSGRRGDGNLDQFTTGATFLAGAARSDFTVVEFNNPIDAEYEVFYAGWSASTDDPTSAVGIHHPNTDEKRISYEYDQTSTTGYITTDFGDGSHIRVADWDVGTTEPGSSGSPLFDQNGRVVGQLHGGYAACGNDDADWYGRISTSWGLGLREVLDPVGTGETYIDGIGFAVDYMVNTSSVEFEGLGNNNVADPGESFRVKLKLKNNGLNPVSGLVFAIESNNAGVTINNGNRGDLNLAVGEETMLVFDVTVAESMACGSDFELRYTFSYHEKEGRGAVAMDVGVEEFYGAVSSPGLQIPDNSAQGIMDMLSIAGSRGTIDLASFEILMDIEHSYIGDLTVSLQAPSGQEVILHDEEGGSSSNIVGAYPTSLTPASSMDVLAGLPFDGEWRLMVKDSASADVGTLRSWGIRQFDRYVCE